MFIIEFFNVITMIAQLFKVWVIINGMIINIVLFHHMHSNLTFCINNRWTDRGIKFSFTSTMFGGIYLTVLINKVKYIGEIMNSELTRKLLDSFYRAQAAFVTLPPLPKGLTPQYVHIIDAITHIEQEQGKVRVSDIASWFNTSVPGVTRSIRAMEELGAVRKIRDEKDRRVVRIALTDLGKEWYDIYLAEYHRKLSGILEDIPESDVETTIKTIQSVVKQMQEHPIELTDKSAGKESPTGGSVEA